MDARLIARMLDQELTFSGNNLPNPPAAGEPPIYRTRFVDGAQQDAFSGAVKATPSVLVTLVLGGLVFVLV